LKTILILASGNGTNARNIISHFTENQEVGIIGVISSSENAGVVEVARSLNTKCLVVDKEELNSGRFVSFLRKANPTLIVLAGFLLMVPKEITEMFRVVNIHPSLLPRHGGKGMHGMNVHRAVIEAGDEESGITIHWADAEYDRGEIIEQHRCKVLPGDTPETLCQRVRQLESAYPEAIERILTLDID
jgi:phosphoribosylglycinamide formyltransferase-1